MFSVALDPRCGDSLSIMRFVVVLTVVMSLLCSDSSFGNPSSQQQDPLFEVSDVLLENIFVKECDNDTVCWSSIRKIENYAGQIPLSEKAVILQIEAIKILAYRFWRHLSLETNASFISEEEIDPIYDKLFDELSDYDLFQTGYFNLALTNFNQTTEGFRSLLSVLIEEILRPYKSSQIAYALKPFTKQALVYFSGKISTLSMCLTVLSQKRAEVLNHPKVIYSDAQYAYKRLLDLTHVQSYDSKDDSPIDDLVENDALPFVFDITSRYITNKINSLMSWNRVQDTSDIGQPFSKLSSYYNVSFTKDALDSLLGRIEAISYFIARGYSPRENAPVFRPIHRYVLHKELYQNAAPQAYLSTGVIATVFELLFPRVSHSDGDVSVTIYDNELNDETRIRRVSDVYLDAIRDTMFHWKILQRIYQKSDIKPIDPFALEYFSERLSEMIGIYLKECELYSLNLGIDEVTEETMISFLDQHFFFLPSSTKTLDTSDVKRDSEEHVFLDYNYPLFQDVSSRSGIRHLMVPNFINKELLFLCFWSVLALVLVTAIFYIWGGYYLLAFSVLLLLVCSTLAVFDLNKQEFSQRTVGTGVAVGDYNQDGLPDLFFPGVGGNYLYKNEGDFSFHNLSYEIGIDDTFYRDSRQALFVDINNDGRQDLFIVHSQSPSQLFLQLHNQTFKNITKISGIKTNVGAQTSLFFDYDGNGLLDLFIGNYGKGKPSTDGRNGIPNQLFKNMGQGVFSEVTHESGLASSRWTLAAASMDVNSDGWQDLIVVNDFGEDQLFINNKEGKFDEMGEHYHFNDRGHGMNASVVDVNHDGNLDVYVTMVDMYSKTEVLKFPTPQDTFSLDDRVLNTSLYLSGNKLLLKQDGARFTPDWMSFGQGDKGWCWGAAFFDYDMDGDEDVYLANGWIPGSSVGYQKDHFYIKYNGGFYRYDKESPLFKASLSRAVSAVDLSNKGKMDLVVTDLVHAPSIFKNLNLANNNWLKVKLRGINHNYFGVGSKVTLFAEGLPMQTKYVTCGSNYLSQEDTTLTFGIKKHIKADRIRVIWPGGEKQLIEGPFTKNTTVVITENITGIPING